MHSEIMIQEMIDAVHREREMTGASHNGTVTRSYRTDKGGLTAGARYMVGSALLRAGRYLQRGTAPRPDLLGS
jgi:hypothetical protein